MAILNPIIPKLRPSRYAAALLDAVNVSAVALMLVMAVKLGLVILNAWVLWAIFALATVAAFRFRPAYLVAGGALLGWLAGLL